MKRFYRFFIILICLFFVLSISCFAADEQDPVPDDPYNSIYSLINEYIYGGSIVAGSYEDLVCIQLSTWICVGFALLPFLVVLWFIRRIC